MSKKVSYSTYIETDALEALKALRNKTRVPVAAYVNQAINDFLAIYDPDIPLADWKAGVRKTK